MKNYIMLCKKDIKSGDKEFQVFFAYRQVKVADKYEDILTPLTDKEGKSIMVARPIKVALSKDMYDKLSAGKFPVGLVLNDELKTKDDKDSFYVSYDKDKDGKTIVFNGKRRPILVIRAVEEQYECAVKPTLDNFDTL